MTTTGGPERSLADPANTEQEGEYPIVVRDDDALDGDDIVIEPDAPTAPRPRRTLAVVIGAIVTVLLIGGVAVALASRDDGDASKLSSSAPVSPPSTQPMAENPKPEPAAADHTKPVKAGTPQPVATVPAGVNPQAPVASPPVETPPVESPPVESPPVVPPVAPQAATPPPPPIAEPPASPTSVLVWQATPGSLTIKAGGHKAFVLRVSNPSNGTVTLPHPLTCAPELRGPQGATIGFGVCVEITQSMAPNAKLTQGYTIYATDTVDAIGKPLKPGNYTVVVEGIYKLPVTITER